VPVIRDADRKTVSEIARESSELAAKARITGRIVQFPANDALEIETYLAAVRQAGLIAEDIEIRKADLEDVFLDVMAEGKS
jgi:ABC-2 type transport system ATP-binding protein